MAVTVTLSTATVAHAAQHEDALNLNRWVPEVIGGAVGGAGGSGLLLYYLLKDIKKETENTAKGSNLDRLREEVNNSLEKKVKTITNELKSMEISIGETIKSTSQAIEEKVETRAEEMRNRFDDGIDDMKKVNREVQTICRDLKTDVGYIKNRY
ncbi:MAG: hypothetical protein TQ37_08490 [Candidatus Synechococcus spongiarum 15L]|uniref:Uncharacterized protein n=2 Tax=Candidatus Synechococcus spongiarum TaxID=431041 RepID=A0A1T1D382_9SYNE|nr:MAG: hypothetical protein TQ37_08490 [Candidatus Synechococcus spongiarum 15L]OOV35301.1 hypothetical protein BV61_01050 [Candidatus Synechococcus spongiarum LMB bulk15M]